MKSHKTKCTILMCDGPPYLIAPIRKQSLGYTIFHMHTWLECSLCTSLSFSHLTIKWTSVYIKICTVAGSLIIN